MTREQQITVVKEMISEAVADGSMTKRCATAIMNAYDEILALPIDVPSDEEIEKEYPSDIEAIRDEWGFPYDCSEEQINFLQTERINAQMKQRAAKWMQDEILKRNRP